MKIIEVNLLEDGWKRKFNISWPCLEKEVTLENGEVVFLELLYLGNDTNLRDREWSLHVDNNRHESLGGGLVSETEQIDEFLEILYSANSSNDIVQGEELVKRGWSRCIDNIILELSPEDEDLAVSWTKGEKKVKGGQNRYNLRISKTSNMLGSDWYVHIDNCDFDSVASMSVRTFDQIQKLISWLDEDEDKDS